MTELFFRRNPPDLPDNFFDLFPDQPRRLPWPATAPPQVLFVANGR